MNQAGDQVRLLFVVHRYAPYPGGSEVYVASMAEEARRRGHDVWVYTDAHMGDLNGVQVTSDVRALLGEWDLIVVHGGDCGAQDRVHMNSRLITSPVLYLLILPSNSHACIRGMEGALHLGCSTRADWDHVNSHGFHHKACQIRHGVALGPGTIGRPGRFRAKYGIPSSTRIFLSCGGFWRHKGFAELVRAFEEARRFSEGCALTAAMDNLGLDGRNVGVAVGASDLNNTILILTGYVDSNDPEARPKDTANVRTLLIEDKTDVADAMADADLYIMNSTAEGFGLVLIEAMLNRTPWLSRRIAGAIEMEEHGYTYDTYDELVCLLREFPFRHMPQMVDEAYTYAMEQRTIVKTIDDVLGMCGGGMA